VSIVTYCSSFFLLVNSTYYVTFSGSLNLISRVSIDSKFDIYVDFFRNRVFLFCFRILDNVNHYFLSLASNFYAYHKIFLMA
jgi:hypothetical protein